MMLPLPLNMRRSMEAGAEQRHVTLAGEAAMFDQIMEPNQSPGPMARSRPMGDDALSGRGRRCIGPHG